jgi:predicted amidohydrolase
MKVAAVQHDVVWEERDTNLQRCSRHVAEAAGLGARLVVFCETFATGYSMNTAKTGEPRGGPTSAWMLAEAAAHDVWVCGSVPEVAPGASLPQNVFVLAGPGGVIHRYAKVHPFTFAGEEQHYDAGDTLATFDVEGVRVSPLVCYDLRFADEFWSLGPGTDVFVVPANWPATRREHWRTLLRARAIENQCYVVGVNRVGSGDGLDYSGDSCIVDPLGRTLAEASEIETVLVADVDREVVASVRDQFRFMPDRR